MAVDIAGAVIKLFTRAAVVTGVEELTPSFRLITLGGDALRNVEWIPGQKVQMLLGWSARTYTPINWDREKGSMQLLAYVHGDAPGARWVRELKVNDVCTMLGPRDSINLNSVDRPALVFGDETSFGLAKSFTATPRGDQQITPLFEVSSAQEARTVLDRIGLANAQIVERKADDAHLAELETCATKIVATQSLAHCVLTGKAPSIQRVHRALKQRGVTGRQIRTKAYWAPGKKGLD